MTIGASLERNGYVQDLLDQPRALYETIAGFTFDRALEAIAADVAAGRFDRIVLTGMGSSLHALHPLHIRLTARGFTSIMAETSELLHYLGRMVEDRTLLVAVSQSGRSVEIVRLLERDEPRPCTIGVTNAADSPLALKPDAVVVTRAGTEGTVASKTYLATLAGLEWLGAVLCGADRKECAGILQQAPGLAQDYLARWKDHVGALLSLAAGVRHVFLTGRGSSLATVGNGALILKESTHVHAEGMSCPAFRHGPFEILRDDVLVLVFRGDLGTAALNERLAEDIRKAGGRVFVVGEQGEPDVFRLPASAAAIRPILEMLPVEMLSLALATLAGHEPGTFRFASKVTIVE